MKNKIQPNFYPVRKDFPKAPSEFFNGVYSIYGRSMFPAIKPASRIRISKVKPEDIKVGDIAFFKRPTGEKILHRVIQIIRKNGSLHFYTKGDNVDILDEGFEQTDLIGKVMEIDGKSIDTQFMRRLNYLVAKRFIWRQNIMSTLRANRIYKILRSIKVKLFTKRPIMPYAIDFVMAPISKLLKCILVFNKKITQFTDRLYITAHGIDISDLQDTELDKLCQAWDSFFKTGSISADILKEKISRKNNLLCPKCLVARFRDEIVGFCLMYIPERSKQNGWIEFLGISPSFEKGALDSVLLDKALHCFKSKGIEFVKVAGAPSGIMPGFCSDFDKGILATFLEKGFSVGRPVIEFGLTRESFSRYYDDNMNEKYAEIMERLVIRDIKHPAYFDVDNGGLFEIKKSIYSSEIRTAVIDYRGEDIGLLEYIAVKDKSVLPACLYRYFRQDKNNIFLERLFIKPQYEELNKLYQAIFAKVCGYFFNKDADSLFGFSYVNSSDNIWNDFSGTGYLTLYGKIEDLG